MKKICLFIVICLMFLTQTIAKANYELVYDDFYLENISYGEQELVSDIFKIRDVASDYDTIILLCSKGINKYPDKPTFYLLRGYFNIKNNNIATGVSDISKSINLNPEFSPIAYYIRGNIYTAERKYGDAEKDLMKFQKLVLSKNKLVRRDFSDRWFRHMTLFSFSGANSNIKRVEYALEQTESTVRNPNAPYLPIYEQINSWYNSALTLYNTLNSTRSNHDQAAFDISEYFCMEFHDFESEISSLKPKLQELTILNNSKKY